MLHCAIIASAREAVQNMHAEAWGGSEDLEKCEGGVLCARQLC